MGFPLFEKTEKTKEVFYIKGKGVVAEGDITNEGFVVYKGSKVTVENVSSFGVSLINRKQKLIDDNILSLQGDCYEFNEDYIFSSCSTAGAIILGRNTNGWSKWKNKEGKSLDEV